MPSIPLASVDGWIHSVMPSIQGRQIPGTADSSPGPFNRGGQREGRGGATLSPGILGAIILSVLAFFAITTGLCAYRDSQRRKEAEKLEAAMKGNPSVTSSVAGVADPPPPYDAVHIPYRHPAVIHQWNRPRENNDAEEGIELHPTITNGMEPGPQSQRT